MTAVSCDVAIVGGGLVGSVLACALAEKGMSCRIVERATPVDLLVVESPGVHGYATRVSALTRASQRILSHLGITAELPLARCCAYQQMCVWDAVAEKQGLSAKIDFDCAQIAEPDLGWIVENPVLQQAVQQRLSALPDVAIWQGQPQAIVEKPDGVTLELHDGRALEAKLIVGADGARSWLREKMAVGISEYDYQQRAIVATVQTEKAHQHTARQAFLATGPLALLPLAEPQYCSLVWSCDREAATALEQQSDAEFQATLQHAFGDSLGAIEAVSKRQAFDLLAQHALDYVRPRLALVGDAAHRLHPLAGQGLNLGLLDVAALRDVLLRCRDKQRDIGALDTLRRYQRWRKGHNAGMLLMMRAFKQLFSGESTVKVRARAFALDRSSQRLGLKRHMMRFALGLTGELPQLAR